MRKLVLMAVAGATATVVGMTALSAAPGAAPAGDANRGKAVFMRCMACHKIDASGTSGVGPNLFGVVGRPVGSFRGYNYSAGMRAKGGVWTPQALDTYLSGPASRTVPGTKMIFMGLPNKGDRDNLIAYLATAGN